MNEIKPPPANSEDSRTDPGMPELRPTVIIAPELQGRRDFIVVREPDDTDADYQARVDLVALLLDHAAKG